MKELKVDPIRKMYEYEVRGGGYFPVDMLRYDEAWPMDAIRMASTFDRANITEVVTIRMRSVRQPTVDRWRSFGWVVL